MDPIKNPFSPGAGSPPPELAGRETVLEQARILLARVKAKRAEKSLLLTGLRGVGKTVLLNEIERIAQQHHYHCIAFEAHQGKSLGQLLAPELRTLLFKLDRLTGTGNQVRRGLAILKSFISAIKIKVGEIDIGIDIEPSLGDADSGDLELDLPSLLIAIGEAAQDRHTAVAILIDEVQYLSPTELSALIMSMHKMQQRQLPLVLVAAGLPILPGLAGESKSYAERLFSFPDIGALEHASAIKALDEPVRAAGEKIERAALDEIFELTRGYPYFLQEWGYQVWNHAARSPITLAVVQAATAVVAQRLDDNFFRVRFNRLTPNESKYLRAMAELGSGIYRSAEIAETLNVKMSDVGTTRDKLIKKGMVYSPAHGDIAFTVPLFDEFMRRAIPTLEPIQIGRGVAEKNK